MCVYVSSAPWLQEGQNAEQAAKLQETLAALNGRGRPCPFMSVHPRTFQAFKTHPYVSSLSPPPTFGGMYLSHPRVKKTRVHLKSRLDFTRAESTNVIGGESESTNEWTNMIVRRPCSTDRRRVPPAPEEPAAATRRREHPLIRTIALKLKKKKKKYK